ncbi:MAG: hypothetical protein QG657_1828 [Acidobacteriota bacterium]|nr:hypothetical protein [Acidobacteriota bacterium]
MNKNEKIVFPPRYNCYEREGWHLLYDPLNVVWIRVNRDGMIILEALKQEGTIANAGGYLAKQFPLETIETIEKIVGAYVANLANIGFLHPVEYRQKKWRHNYQDVPSDIYLMMTHQCNLKCVYCYNDADREQFRQMDETEPEMSKDQYLQFFEDAAALGVERILFTGGEPLLNPFTLEAARYVRQLGLKVEIITNGLMVTEANAAEMAETFDYISISLDSFKPETHEKMRGKRTHQRVLGSILLLKEKGATVRVNSVITGNNVGEIPETWKYAVEELKCDSYTPSLYAPGSSDPEAWELLPEMETLWKEKKRAGQVLNKVPAVVTKTSSLRFSCGIANGEIGIAYDGSVYPCHLLHKPELKCGNLKEKRLGEILEKSELMSRLRTFHIDQNQQCRECDFRYLCGGGCLAMTYNIHGNFYENRHLYCQYLKEEHLERMWTMTVSDIAGRNTIEKVQHGR